MEQTAGIEGLEAFLSTNLSHRSVCDHREVGTFASGFAPITTKSSFLGLVSSLASVLARTSAWSRCDRASGRGSWPVA